MDTLTITLPEPEAQRLRALADRLGTSPEEFAAAAVRQRLDEAQQAEEFDRLAERVVQKNTELYRRLA
jgi:predicted transcriptional regulator